MSRLRRHLLPCALALLAGAAAAPAQTAEDLRGRYGLPASETHSRRPGLGLDYGAAAESYVVRPDILATAFFGEGGEVCRAELKPFSASPELFPAPETFSAEEAARVVEELAPAESRGPSALRYTTPRSYASFEFEEYERVTISREVARGGGGRGLRAVRVGWKWRDCPAASPPPPPDPQSRFNTGGRRK